MTHLLTFSTRHVLPPGRQYYPPQARQGAALPRRVHPDEEASAAYRAQDQSFTALQLSENT